MFRRHLKEYAPVLILHPQEEFQFKPHLVLQAILPEAIPRFHPSAKNRLTELILARNRFSTKAFFRQFASEQKCRHRHPSVHDVLAIVPRIVPAAMGVPHALSLHTWVKFNRIVAMRRRTHPLPRKFGQKIHPAPLEIKRLDIRKQLTINPAVRNYERGSFKQQHFLLYAVFLPNLDCIVAELPDHRKITRPEQFPCVLAKSPVFKGTVPKTALVHLHTIHTATDFHDSKEIVVYSKSITRQVFRIHKENLGTLGGISHMVIADRYFHSARIAFQNESHYPFRHLFVYRRNRLPYKRNFGRIPRQFIGRFQVERQPFQ